MGAPKGQKPNVPFENGNQEWLNRSKHGRDKLFTSPQLLLEAAQEYFKWCEDHPMMEYQPFSYQGKIVMSKIPKLRPFTREGFMLFIGASSSWMRHFKSTATEKEKDFITVIGEIEDAIDNQQYSGAAAGFLNANIVARKLGLGDKMQNEHSGSLPVNITGMVIK